MAIKSNKVVSYTHHADRFISLIQDNSNWSLSIRDKNDDTRVMYESLHLYNKDDILLLLEELKDVIHFALEIEKNSHAYQ